jgi:hypothetical protein
MGTYNKQFEHQGYKFNIKVELDYQVERRPNGKREHLVVVNEMGPTNYYEKFLVETKNLPGELNSATNRAIQWVDRLLNNQKTDDEKLLESLGFSR